MSYETWDLLIKATWGIVEVTGLILAVYYLRRFTKAVEAVLSGQIKIESTTTTETTTVRSKKKDDS